MEERDRDGREGERRWKKENGTARLRKREQNRKERKGKRKETEEER
jgi:hypothetical protein